jgi:hypothetical protein
MALLGSHRCSSIVSKTRASFPSRAVGQDEDASIAPKEEQKMSVTHPCTISEMEMNDV